LRILVTDDHQQFRRLLCRVLEAEEGWEVCGEAKNGREGLALALQLKPDVVILDLAMPELNGLEAARQIHRTLPQTNVVILTAYECEELRHASLDFGANAWAVKTDLACLIMEIRNLFESKKPPPDTTQSESDENLIASLTGQDREILRLLARSKTTREIATALSIDITAVEAARSRIMEKLQLKSIVDLVRYARHHRVAQ
jgi:DNA-binding NarL/FixJ family response regulator